MVSSLAFVIVLNYIAEHSLPSDIINLLCSIGHSPSEAWRKKYLNLCREVILYDDWMLSMSNRGYDVVLIGADLLRLGRFVSNSKKNPVCLHYSGTDESDRCYEKLKKKGSEFPSSSRTLVCKDGPFEIWPLVVPSKQCIENHYSMREKMKNIWYPMPHRYRRASLKRSGGCAVDYTRYNSDIVLLNMLEESNHQENNGIPHVISRWIGYLGNMKLRPFMGVEPDVPMVQGHLSNWVAPVGQYGSHVIAKFPMTPRHTLGSTNLHIEMESIVRCDIDDLMCNPALSYYVSNGRMPALPTYQDEKFLRENTTFPEGIVSCDRNGTGCHTYYYNRKDCKLGVSRGIPRSAPQRSYKDCRDMVRGGYVVATISVCTKTSADWSDGVIPTFSDITIPISNESSHKVCLPGLKGIPYRELAEVESEASYPELFV